MPRRKNETPKEYNARRSRELTQRRRDAGMQTVSNIWAPDDPVLRMEIRKAAKRVIKKWEKKQLAKKGGKKNG